MSDILYELSLPFYPNLITFKPQGRASSGYMAGLAYADLRCYMERLDQVVGTGWDISYQPWGDGRLICTITIRTEDGPVSRSSTGEVTQEGERGEIGGTVAEAQAFKRACAMFGLGRYLYEMPRITVPWSSDKRAFTEQDLAKLRRPIIEHYERVMGDKVVMGTTTQEEDELWSATAPQDENFYPTPTPPTNAVIPPGKPAEMVTWLRKESYEPWASEAQVKMLQRRLGEILGADVRKEEDCLRLGKPMMALMWGSTTNINKKVASLMIDRISKDKWDRETKQSNPNPSFNPDTVGAIQDLAAANNIGGSE